MNKRFFEGRDGCKIREEQKQQPEKMETEGTSDIVTNENIFDVLNSKDNIDLLAIKAENALKRFDFNEAYKISLK